ncbi:hypothetical protein KC367_g48 [Hortaea werneckii]|nr:hypothetical protein KC367_g48 [Hortaea werneckii]
MNQHGVEQFVTKESGIAHQRSAGSRHEDAPPLPPEAAQLEAEAAKQESPAAAKGSEGVKPADEESHKRKTVGRERMYGPEEATAMLSRQVVWAALAISYHSAIEYC